MSNRSSYCIWNPRFMTVDTLPEVAIRPSEMTVAKPTFPKVCRSRLDLVVLCVCRDKGSIVKDY